MAAKAEIMEVAEGHVKEAGTKPATRGRPKGTKNPPGSKKPGPKPKAKTKLPSPQAKKGKLGDFRTPRRSDLPGSDAGIDTSNFAGRLAMCRLRCDLTQEALGKSVGRTRQAIRQYESEESMPNLEVIEGLAKRLGVSATYLAFGEQAIKVSKPEDALSINEIAFQNGRRVTTGSFVVTTDFAASLTEETSALRVYKLDHKAAEFQLTAGDRLFIDIRKTEMSIKNDLYAIVIGGEMEVVRYEPSAGGKSMVAYTTPTGKTVEAKAKDITVIGAVVATLKKR